MTGMGGPEAEHGRLVGRLKRQIAKVDEKGSTPGRRAKIRATIVELIRLERRMADPLAPAVPVTQEDFLARVALMKPGAGIEVG